MRPGIPAQNSYLNPKTTPFHSSLRLLSLQRPLQRHPARHRQQVRQAIPPSSLTSSSRYLHHLDPSRMSEQINTQDVAASGDKSELDTQILDIFQKILNNASATEQSAEESAEEIDELFKSHQAKGTDAEDFLWKFWTLLIEVAKKVPATDSRQSQLVTVIEKLKAKKGETVEIWGQQAAMWDDLALFGPCMREAWNMDVKFDGSEADDAKVQEWASLNSFAARLYGASLQSWINLGIWELRAGLEEPAPSAANKDLHLTTACEWLTHAAKALHEEGKQGKELEAFEARALKSGSLLEGQAGATPERWQFWKKRLGELAPEASSTDLKARIDKVIEHMNSVEA